jgi:hypothetical protein
MVVAATPTKTHNAFREYRGWAEGLVVSFGPAVW